MDEPNRRSPHFPLLLWILCGLVLGSGCVHRRMTIDSNPGGALVVLDGKEVGYTPVSVDFTYYGTREVTLVRDGFATQTYPAHLNAPWYQRFPLDFISDNFLPYQITDRHRFQFQMQPEAPGSVSQTDLLNRGDAFRSEAMLSQ